MNDRLSKRKQGQADAHRWVLAVVAFSTCGLGAAAEPQKTLVSGRVVDYLARPVDGAEVTVFERVHDFLTDRDVVRPEGEIAKTDANGRFALAAGVVPSYHTFVVARKDGYALGWDLLTHVDNKAIVLEKPVVLAGVVVDAAGRPIADAKVRAVPKSTYLRRLEQEPVLAPESWLTIRTDDRGAFRFDQFGADVSADFWVEAPGRALIYQYTTHRLTACGFEAGRTDIRLVLPKETPLHGCVIEAEDGRPVAGAHVLLHSQGTDPQTNPFLPESTTSGREGQFAFKGVPSGQRYINISAPERTGLVDQRVALDVGADGNVEEVTVRLAHGGLIEMVAREGQTGQPIARLGVYFWKTIQNERFTFYKDVVADANGVLHVAAPAGECQFSTGVEGYSPSSHRGTVLVTAGQTTKAEIVMDRDPRLTGIVLDTGGQPVSGALVNNGAASTDAGGQFEVRVPADSLAEKWIIRHLQRNLAAVVDIQHDGQPAQITLKPALIVAGRITDPKGAGIPAARMALHARIPQVSLPYGQEFLTDSQGRYEMTAVAPGQDGVEYRLSVNASGYGTRQFRPISIRGKPGTRVSLDPIILEPAEESISGVVVDAQGRPAGGLPIFAQGPNQPTRITATDSEGRFLVRRVCNGPVKIQAGSSNRREETGSVQAEGGDQEVKIILGQEGFHLRYASLKGKPLPDTGDLDLEPASASREGKRILVCFFDLQQRPSRNAVVELARQTGPLTQRGIILVGVQAARMERTEIEKWMADNRVSFPVGMIRTDEEKTRRTWGVRSLPWLILADRTHAVVAEGFLPTELGQEIGKMEDSQP